MENNNQVVVSVHKAYTKKINEITDELQKFHSINGKSLPHQEVGDFVQIILPKTSYNSIENVQRTLVKYEGTPAYYSGNVSEVSFEKESNLVIDNMKSIRKSLTQENVENKIKIK